ncbi:Cytochrome P450 monooxygenase [Lachnellula occidentalis]|uniref:Cytochrome P450 monooxygenase n=1 Tax=Lachnellula occidentalis TaxID=215460 RepID=A0A8H8UAF0_9HELO|nr:Cytochrome P450 monooxygenase [Lachnellula occidentalis]
MYDFTLVHAGVTLVVIIGIYKLLQIGRRDSRMPPGPPTLPILGNLHQVPITGLYKQFKTWSLEYGGVYSLKFGPSNVIILCNKKAIHELWDKKGLVYAERPKNYVADIITSGDSIVFAPNTVETREKRRIATHNFSPRILDEKAAVVQDAEVTVLMHQLLTDPDNFYNHVKRTTSSISCILIYGQRGPTYENFWGHAVYDALDLFGEALEPGANPPVDEYPFLKLIPERFAFWKRRAYNAGNAMHDIWTKARVLVEERRALGDHRVSLADKLMDEYKEKGMPMTQHALDQLFGELVEGGAETTSSSMLTMILALAKNPWVQEKAKKELDEVCGGDRMPEWADFNRLPYINSIVKEGMRWRPAVATGIPRRTASDDWYEGMFIPKGSTVFLPIWAVHHMETEGYDSPFTFNPDRYINHHKLANDYAGSVHLAERNQWRIVAKLIWAFEIKEPVDSNGKTISLDADDYTTGLLHAPNPYKVIFKPRSPAHIATITREIEHSLESLAPFE